jgi:ADP-ribose pyrophosphatase
MARQLQAVVHGAVTVYAGRYRMVRVRFSCDGPSGRGRHENVEREVFERGDSAAALVHDVERDTIVLAEQFRVATFARGPGYIQELPAGSLEPGETAEACIRRELLEETGYRAGELEVIATYYPSPGASSERVHLFYAPVRPADLVDPAAAGLASEQEDILRVETPREAFLRAAELGRLADGKALLAALWLANRPQRGAPGSLGGDG